MKKVVVATLSVAISLGASPPASADPGKEIRVTGYTEWRETYTVIRELHNKWGVPISSKRCRTREQYCVTIRHINAPNGQAGLTAGTTGNATVTLNNYYAGNNPSYRKAVLYHELGHVAGLWEHSDCSSSMSARIAQCGYFVLGYNSAEQEKLREIWGG